MVGAGERSGREEVERGQGRESDAGDVNLSVEWKGSDMA